MFKKLGALLATIVLLGAAPLAESATITKTVKYGGPGGHAWVFQYIDGWGGENYQCSASGGSCGLWDWQSIYPLGVSGEDPNPEINTAEYFHGLVQTAVGGDAPDYLPTLFITYD